MSWSIEEHIGDCRPFPSQVVVYKGETGECLAYVSGEVADRLMSENSKLRELVRDTWHLFTEHGAVNPCDLPAVDAVRNRMRKLEVDE